MTGSRSSLPHSPALLPSRPPTRAAGCKRRCEHGVRNRPVAVPPPPRYDSMLASDWLAPDGQCDRWQPFADRQVVFRFVGHLPAARASASMRTGLRAGVPQTQKPARVPRWQQGVATTLRSGPGYHVCGSTALSPKRQIQRHLRVQQRPESEVHVEGLGHIVFRIHDQRIGCNLLPGLQASIDGASQQQLPKATTPLDPIGRRVGPCGSRVPGIGATSCARPRKVAAHRPLPR